MSTSLLKPLFLSGGGGGSGTVGPVSASVFTVYIDSTFGNDTTAAINDPSKPYLTGDAAYAAYNAFAAAHADMQARFEIFGGPTINLTDALINVIINIPSPGHGLTINSNGADGTDGTVESPAGTDGTPGYGGYIYVEGFGSISINSNGGDGGDGLVSAPESNGGNGGAAGTWFVTGSRDSTLNLNFSGGHGGDPGAEGSLCGNSGGIAGVYVTGFRFISVIAASGNPGFDGTVSGVQGGGSFNFADTTLYSIDCTSDSESSLVFYLNNCQTYWVSGACTLHMFGGSLAAAMFGTTIVAYGFDGSPDTTPTTVATIPAIFT